MSRFAEVVVLARGGEQVMEPLTRSDESREWHQCFTRIDDSVFAGTGRGSSECYMWVVQFSRHNWCNLFATLEALAWPDPYAVQVLVRDEEDDCFGLWMIYDGRLTEVALPHTARTEFQSSVTGVLTRVDKPRSP